jgi:hypothetical protein
MATNIRHKRSAVAGKIPTASQLQSGELAINTADGKVFLLRDDNTVQDITNRVFDNDTQILVEDKGDSSQAQIKVDVNGFEKITITEQEFNMKMPLDMENAEAITFRELTASGLDGVELKAPDTLPGSYTMTLPLRQGTIGQVLKTDGNGQLEFTDPDIFGGNVIYVSQEQGDDDNDGQSAPVKTVKRACQLASALVYNTDGTRNNRRINVKVAVGDYTEDNPIIIPDNVVVKGDGLRGCIIRPANANLDMFRVRNACYFGEFTFRDGVDDNFVPLITWDYATVFDDPDDPNCSRVGYTNLPNTQPTIDTSPYIQNASIISFLGGSGSKIDGAKIQSPNVPQFAIEAENPTIGAVPEQGKSMVANAYTMLSFGGTGWRLLNDAYAQIVSCFQIFLLNGVYTQSGGYCSITNSATNFGLYALRSSGYSPKAFVFDRAFVTSTGASDGKQTVTVAGINRDAPVEEFVLRFRDPGYKYAHDVITNNINSIADDTVDWIQNNIATASVSIWSGFTYDEAKCQRDTRLLLDAIRYDIIFNSNYRTVSAALKYFNGTFPTFSTQKDQHIDAFTQAKAYTANYISDATAISRSNALWDEIIDILTNGDTDTVPGDGVADAYTRPIPTGGTNNASDSGFANAVTQLINNKAFIQDEVTSWIADQIAAETSPFASDFTYNEAKCERDIGLIIDALVYDITYGGNLQSVEAALAYFVGTVAQYGSGKKEETIAAYGRLKTVIGQVIQETTVTTSSGTTETQDTSAAAGSAAAALAAETNVQLIIDYIDVDGATAPTKIEPDLTWVQSNSEYSAYGELDAEGQKNLAQNVTRYINTQIQANLWYGFTYDVEKCRRDTKLIVEAVAKDTWDTGNRYTRNAGLAYFRQNLADSSEITISGQELQTEAAIQQAAVYTIATITGKPGITTAIEDFVNERFDIVSNAIVDPGDIPNPTEVSSEGDITNDFKTAPAEQTFDAAGDVATGTGIFTITDHGYANGTKVIYNSNGNTDIGGLENETTYYIKIINDDEFTLTFDDSLEFPVQLFTNISNTGTHKFLSGIIEFFVEEVTASHQTYQTLILESGAETYEFIPGRSIAGTTGVNNNSAIVTKWEPDERRLTVSIEEVTVGSSTLRIQFDTSSTITSDHAASPNLAITLLEVAAKTGLGTATFTITATDGSSSLTNLANLPENQVWFHRPSIVNSSAHTWEYAGSGTDYNALPQNGGNTREEYEQFEELPGRVYSSGTNELGDFKVGDFITAFNRTGNITFRNKVQVDELDALRLSVSDVEIEEISTDVNLGDSEQGGASDSRLSTQLAVRSFISNRLGGFVDKSVSTAAVPGAIVQLNVNGQLNADLIPATRQFTNTNTNGYQSRLEQVENVPTVDLKAGDIATENYEQVELTLSGTITANDGDIITQPGVTGARGYAKGDFPNSSTILVVTTGEAWDENEDSTGDPWEVGDGNLFVNGVDSGENVSSKGASTEIVDNWFLKSSNSSQYLVVDNDEDYNFTFVGVANAQRTSNVTTVTTNAPHNLKVNNNVALRIDGQDTFKQNGLVQSVIDGFRFTLNNTGDDTTLLTGITGTVETIVTSADGDAQGKVTDFREGMLVGVDNANITGGSGYTPTTGSTIYEDVPLQASTGVGRGARANITVTAGAVTDVDLIRSGTGYAEGDLVTADAVDMAGDSSGSGFEIEVTSVEKRVYVDIIGGTLFVASTSSQDFVEDNDAIDEARVINLDDVISHNFLAGSNAASGNVDYTNYRIEITNHGYSNGDPVKYDTLGGVAIGGLTNGEVYYVKVFNANTIELFDDYDLDTKIDFSSTPANTNHNLTRSTVNLIDNSIVVENHGFTTGDAIRLETLSDGSTTNALPSIVSNNDPITTGSRFFIGSVTTNSFTLHNLRSDALSSVNGLTTLAVDLDDEGTGSAQVILNNTKVSTVVNTSSRLLANWNTLAVTNIDAENIISGTISPSRLALAGVANSDSALFGDSSYKTVVQSLKKANTTDNPITLTGSSVGGEFYGDPVNIGIANADFVIGGTFSTLGVSRFLQTQFDVADDASGQVFIKDGVVDAGTLDSLDSSYFLNPANLTSLVPVSRGGTAIGTYAVGDIIYAQSTGSLNTLNIGRANTFLKSTGTVPEWGTALDLAEGLDVGSAKLSSTSTALGQVYNSAVTTLELGGEADNVKIGKSGDNRDIAAFVSNYDGTATQDVAVNLSSITADTSEASQNGENVLLFSADDIGSILFGMTVSGSGSIPANTTVSGVTDTEVFLSNDLTGNVLTTTTITFTYSPLTLGIRDGDEITIASSGVTNLDGTWPVSGATENATSFTVRTDANVTADEVTQVGTIVKENNMLLRNEEIVFGSAINSDNPQDAVLRGESGLGTDVGGGAIVLQAGTGTGNATGGDIVMKTGAVSTTSDIRHTQTERFRINTSGKMTVTGYSEFTDTTAIKVPVGTSAQRPGETGITTPEAQGQIRYNTSDSTFEGYDGTNWGSLGGVKDVDQDTLIRPETSAGADNDELDFLTAGTQRMQIGATGDLGFGDGLNKFTVAFTTGNTDIAGDLVVTGDLTVNGTTTTIDTATLAVEDKNIELGNVTTPTDTTADGGGITLKGATDHTFNWVNATDAWTSSENIDLASGKAYYVNGFSVLSSTTLGTAVINSSLQGLGAVNSGSITSGFGNIDIGSSNLTATGTVSLGATSFGDNNITNVGSIALDTISGDNGSSMNFASNTQVNIDSTTQATNTTTGALIVDGGVGIAKNLHVGGTYNGNGSGLTTLNASNLSSGTVNDARLPTSQAGKTFTSDITVNGFRIGQGALAETSNLVVGGGASITTGAQNNTGVGSGSFGGAISGDNNTALGYVALSAMTTASNNTAIGAHSQEQRVANGSKNTSVGTDTMSNSTQGDDNTGIGYKALEIVTGDQNTVVGSQSGSALSSGSNNVIIGYDIELPTNTTSNYIQLGNASSATFSVPGVNISANATTFSYSGTGGFAGVGSSLTALNATQLTSGTVPDARISQTSVTQHETAIDAVGTLDGGAISSGFGNIDIGSSNLTATGTVSLGTTSFNDNNISNVGQISLDTIAPDNGTSLNFASTGIVTFDNVTEATTTANGSVRLKGGLSVVKNIQLGGTITGNGSGLTSLNASNLGSGTVPSARIDGSYTSITGVGALDAGQITSGFGDIDIGTNTFTGNGSGLTSVDADSLGGVAAANYLRSNANDTFTGLLTGNRNANEQIRLATQSATGSPYMSFYQAGTRRGYIQYVNGGAMRIYNDRTDEYLDINSGANGLTYTVSGAATYTVWHSGNDGAGSGLDADTLDTLSSGSFLRSDANDSFSGTLSGAGAINITGNITANAFTGDGSALTGISADDADSLGGVAASGYLRSNASDTMDAGTNTTLTILSDDGGASTIQLYGNSQGTGRVYVGQSTAYGGGIEYNGDNSPATTGAGADKITLWRRDNGTDSWTARNAYNSNNWEFRGEVTAYASDARLKDVSGNIDNAVEKVKALNGVIYTWNDTAIEKGLKTEADGKAPEAGLLAQEVQKVLPEVVAPAPFDDEYLTIKYERVVPLLVEAIKEQQTQIDELKEMVQKLLNK